MCPCLKWIPQIKNFSLKCFNSMCAGDPVLHLCPAGHYCDGIPGSDFTRGAGPRPCPLYTYRASAGAGSKGDCMPCPPGSHCNSTGLKHSISIHSSCKSPFHSKWTYFKLFSKNDHSLASVLDTSHIISPAYTHFQMDACNKVGWLHSASIPLKPLLCAIQNLFLCKHILF